jgi:hypothetical protein
MHRAVKNSCRALMRKSERKLPVGILRFRWDDCIEISRKLMH